MPTQKARVPTPVPPELGDKRTRSTGPRGGVATQPKPRSFVYDGPVAGFRKGFLLSFVQERNVTLGYLLARHEPEICRAFMDNPKQAFHRIELVPWKDRENEYRLLIGSRWTFQGQPEGDLTFKPDGVLIVSEAGQRTKIALSAFSIAGYEVFINPLLERLRLEGALYEPESEWKPDLAFFDRALRDPAFRAQCESDKMPTKARTAMVKWPEAWAIYKIVNEKPGLSNEAVAEQVGGTLSGKDVTVYLRWVKNILAFHEAQERN